MLRWRWGIGLDHGLRQEDGSEYLHGVAADNDDEEGQNDDEQIAQVEFPEQR